MNEKENEKKLDELIARSINQGSLRFDADAWKKKYPAQWQMLKARNVRDNFALQPNIYRKIIARRITKVAAAVVVIGAIGVFVFHRGTRQQAGTPRVSEVAKSPAEMLTAMSLRVAYRRGGMEAVEEQFHRAYRLLGPQPKNPTLQELIKELESSQSERTEL